MTKPPWIITGSSITSQSYLKYIKFFCNRILLTNQTILTIHRTRNCVDDIARTVIFDGG